jgi:hypothetical protein
MSCEMKRSFNEHRLNIGKFNLCMKQVGRESWENITTYETFSSVGKGDTIV